MPPLNCKLPMTKSQKASINRRISKYQTHLQTNRQRVVGYFTDILRIYSGSLYQGKIRRIFGASRRTKKQDLITQIKWIYVLQIVSDYKLFPLHPYILFMPDASLFLRHLEIHPVINQSPALSINSDGLYTVYESYYMNGGSVYQINLYYG